MAETDLEDLKRYVGFDRNDEVRLQAFAVRAAAHFEKVAEVFYARLIEHEQARAVLTGPEQVARHRTSLREWMQLLFEGPWDEAYYQRRLRIGRVHVQVALPQRYVLTAMNVLRMEFVELVRRELPASEARALERSVHKILDIELAIMLESYREAFVAHVQRNERLERDELQRRLEISEARYGEIVEKAEALITTFGHDGRVILFNAKCERLTGLTRAEAQERRWLDLFVPPPDHAGVRARFEQTRAGVLAAAYEGVVPIVESRLCRVRWHFTVLPGGADAALCAIGLDVSNEHDLGVRTRRAERLAALGTMAAGLAHEVRNPLNSAHLQLTVAERRLSRADADVAGAKQAVRVADAEMQRLGVLVDDFLRFAKPQPLRLEPADLRATVTAVVSLLEPEARERGVQLAVQPGSGAVVEIDEEKIKQVLLNLLRNAIDATAIGGRVELGVDVRGTVVELHVRDTGTGLDVDQPIFEPFFTTKEHGTGLGLAIVHRIVMDHGGQVAVRSTPGDTQFTVTLPRTHTG